MPKLADKLPKGKLDKRPDVPVWQGPSAEGPLGGVTQSMIVGGHGFLVCRERFRLHYIEGIRASGTFRHGMEYGTMWHLCEEGLAAGKDYEQALKDYCVSLCQTYPTQQEQVNQWYQICKRQFPLYVDHWKRHPDVKQRTPLLQEAVFDVPYLLPSGRTVRLRGKFDSVDLIGRDGIYLQENKTKGDIDQLQLQSNLRCDFQTSMYLIALREGAKQKQFALPAKPLKGVRYNVVRRPLSGGKHSIRQHKPTKSNPQGESSAAFYDRLCGLIKEDIDHFFMRWKVNVLASDIKTFEQRTFIPVLEQLCDWYEWITYCLKRQISPFFEQANGIHWMYPYGVYNVVNETGSSDLDEHIHTGSMVGLSRTNELFKELQ